jgi:6-phosphogluconolactonase
MREIRFQILLSLFAFGAFAQTNTYLFVGTYTDNKPDKGIYIYKFNEETGELKQTGSAENITNPSYLTVSNNGKYLYACTDTKIPDAGSVSAFKVDSVNGTLTFINTQSSGGENPVYLTTSKDDKFVINGNYTEGTTSVFTTNENGSLNPYSQLFRFDGNSINSKRQEKSHIHSTVFSPDFNYIFLRDLGADKIRAFQFDANNSKQLAPMEKLDINTIPGSGPRHFTFHPNKQYGYCIEELSGMVSAYQYKNGQLDSLQRIFAYSKFQEEYNSADIHISPDGLFLYASNRWEKENTIAIFSIDQQNGTLSLIGHQKTLGENPRNFTIAPSGNYLLVANQATNNIVVFERNPTTGLLRKTGHEVYAPSPSCLQMRNYRK